MGLDVAAVRPGGDVEFAAEGPGVVPRLQGRAEDHHLHRHLYHAVGQGVFGRDRQKPFLAFLHAGRLAANHAHAFALNAPVEFLVPFAETAHVDVKIGYLRVVAALVLEKVGVFKGIHAAGAGAVLVKVDVPAADAVQDGHAFGRVGKGQPVAGVAFSPALCVACGILLAKTLG